MFTSDIEWDEIYTAIGGIRNGVILRRQGREITIDVPNLLPPEKAALERVLASRGYKLRR